MTEFSARYCRTIARSSYSARGCPLLGQPIPTLHSLLLSKVVWGRAKVLSAIDLVSAARGMTLALPTLRRVAHNTEEVPLGRSPRTPKKDRPKCTDRRRRLARRGRHRRAGQAQAGRADRRIGDPVHGFRPPRRV